MKKREARRPAPRVGEVGRSTKRRTDPTDNVGQETENVGQKTERSVGSEALPRANDSGGTPIVARGMDMNLVAEDNSIPEVILTEEAVSAAEAVENAIRYSFAESLARTYAERRPSEQLGALHRV